MTDRDLLQQALDALENISEFAVGEGDVCEIIAKRARLAIPALRERLAQPEPVSDAGIKIWIGNKQVVQHLTQTQLHYARDPWMLVELTADKCIAALKEKVND